MNDELINAKVNNWLMRGEITDFDVNQLSILQGNLLLKNLC